MVDIREFMKSSYTIEIIGEQTERFLNLAASRGIYVSRVKPVEGGIRLRLSRRAYEIMSVELPTGLEMKRLGEHGAPRILRKFKKRYFLIGGIPMVLAAVLLASQYVWRIELNGGDENLQKEVSAFLNENGICTGIKKSKINQIEVKREAILSIDDLMWLWLDIKGTTVYVNIESRDMPPESASTEPANVVATESGVIESITTLRGVPLVGEGQTVEKGDILISGVITSERLDRPMLRHAEGKVAANVWRDKVVLIPKKTERREYTGTEQKVRAIKIKKFIVNFSLNSSILYPKYDKIRSRYRLGNFPVEFICDTYKEVLSEPVDTDIAQASEKIKTNFEKEISESGARLISMDEKQTDKGDCVEYSLTAHCLTDIAKTVPLEE